MDNKKCNEFLRHSGIYFEGAEQSFLSCGNENFTTSEEMLENIKLRLEELNVLYKGMVMVNLWGIFRVLLEFRRRAWRGIRWICPP